MHVNAEALVDIAEGVRPESSEPHLAGCERCRTQLRELRAMMSEVRGVDVPEPSPLFWDHLSSRVSEAVANDGDARLKPSRYATSRRSSPWCTASGGGSRRITASEAGSRYVPFGAWAGRFWVHAAIGITVVAISIVVGSGPRAPVVHAPSLVVDVADAGTPIELLRDVSSDEDVSLMMVASLTDDVDLDTAREAGLATRGSADNAVAHMSASELRELERLLKEELSRPGA
jgi:hypothetical protein